MYSWGLSFNVRQHPEVHLKYSQTNSRESPFSHKKRIVLLRRVIHCIIRVREIIRLNFKKERSLFWMNYLPHFVHLFICQFWQILEMDYPCQYEWRGQREDKTRTARYPYSSVVGHVIANRETRVQTRLDHQCGTRNDILLGEHKKSLLQLRCSQPWASDAEELGLNFTPAHS